MIYNIFTTFEEAKESEHYDHLFQKMQDLSLASGVSLDIIRENNLHIQDSEGVFPLDNYIIENGIIIEYPDIYHHAKRIWRRTSGWALIYKYNNCFVYRKDHSDRKYNTVNIDDKSLLKQIDEFGNEILILEQF